MTTTMYAIHSFVVNNANVTQYIFKHFLILQLIEDDLRFIKTFKLCKQTEKDKIKETKIFCRF